MRADLVVVGAGPAGGMAALAAARGGLTVALLDRKKVVGEPVQCGESVSRFALESNGLRPDPRFVRHVVREARAVMPNGRSFPITRRPGYSIDRAEFDRSIADAAVAAGADLFLNERVRSIRRENGAWELRSDGGSWTAPLVVGADGPASLVARWAGLLESSVSVQGYEWRFDASEVPPADPDAFLLYFGRRYDGGYAWIFPRGREVNVGAGGPIDAHRALAEFCERRGIDPARRLRTIAGQIPYHFILRRYAADGVAIAGDAAGLTNPMNGGGIHAALFSGRVAGELAAAGRLDDYDSVVQASPFIDPLLYRTTEELRRWDDGILDFLGDALEGEDWHSFPVLHALRFALPRPRMLLHGPGFRRLLRAVRITEVYGW